MDGFTDTEAAEYMRIKKFKADTMPPMSIIFKAIGTRPKSLNALISSASDYMSYNSYLRQINIYALSRVAELCACAHHISPGAVEQIMAKLLSGSEVGGIDVTILTRTTPQLLAPCLNAYRSMLYEIQSKKYIFASPPHRNAAMAHLSRQVSVADEASKTDDHSSNIQESSVA